MNLTLTEIGASASALLAIATAMHVLVVRPVRSFFRREVRDEMARLAGQLQTNGNRTLGEYVEGSAETLSAIRDELHETNTMALANQHQILAMYTRFDDHLVNYHSQGGE